MEKRLAWTAVTDDEQISRQARSWRLSAVWIGILGLAASMWLGHGPTEFRFSSEISVKTASAAIAIPDLGDIIAGQVRTDLLVLLIGSPI